MLKSNLRYKLGALAPLFKVARTISTGNKGVVKVLLFHDIPEDKLDVFKSQINYLRNNYKFICPVDFHAFLRGQKELCGLNILISFDDGFLSSKRAIEYALEPNGIKAIFFITAGFIGLKDGWKEFAAKKILDGSCSEDQLCPEHAPMDWDDVNRLIERGHTIGSHSVNHFRLSCLEKEELEYEINESSEILEKGTGVLPETFAFPFGDIGSIDENVLVAIQKRYKYCYSGIRGLNKKSISSFAILRDEVSLSYPHDYVEFIVENGLGTRYAKNVKQLNNAVLSV